MTTDRAASGAAWQPTQAGVDAVMAAANTPVDDEGVEVVTDTAQDVRTFSGIPFTVKPDKYVCTLCRERLDKTNDALYVHVAVCPASGT